MPDTKWENRLDETGICSACRYVEVKEKTDWEKRIKGNAERFTRSSLI